MRFRGLGLGVSVVGLLGSFVRGSEFRTEHRCKAPCIEKGALQLLGGSFGFGFTYSLRCSCFLGLPCGILNIELG